MIAYSNDLIDSLLFAASHKGVPVLQSTTTNASAGPITYAQVIAGYNKAMKSNPNPYLGTPPFTANGPAQAKSGLDVVIRREILPGCIDDVAGADAFDSWTWHGFVDGLAGSIGIISARYIPTNTHHQKRFQISRSAFDRALVDHANQNQQDKLFSAIDAQVMQAVCDIVSSVLPPHDITTCTDPECYC